MNYLDRYIIWIQHIECHIIFAKYSDILYDIVSNSIFIWQSVWHKNIFWHFIWHSTGHIPWDFRHVKYSVFGYPLTDPASGDKNMQKRGFRLAKTFLSVADWYLHILYIYILICIILYYNIIYIYICIRIIHFYPIYPMIIVFLSAMDPNCAPQQPPEPNGSGGWLQESLQLVVSLARHNARRSALGAKHNRNGSKPMGFFWEFMGF